MTIISYATNCGLTLGAYPTQEASFMIARVIIYELSRVYSKGHNANHYYDRKLQL